MRGCVNFDWLYASVKGGLGCLERHGREENVLERERLFA